MFVRKRLLRLDPWYYGILISPPHLTGNKCLLDYWRRYIGVVRSPMWAKILLPLIRFPYLVYDARTAAINQTGPQVAVYREWGKRPALLKLREDHRKEGYAWLLQMGLSSGQEFVCFHTREPGYGDDDALQAYRNSSIENYLFAVSELRKHGFWCIRMGHSAKTSLPPMEGVIDYAHSAVRSDWLDVFLCAECKFFLAGSSGLLFVANLFGKPCAPANQAPLSSVLAFSAQDVAIPKLLWSEREERYLTFAEAFRSEVSSFRYSHLYQQQSIRTVENTAEDVRDLALEMLERAEGRAVYTTKDEEAQQRFKALMRPGHYGYGGVNRVGRDFLRKYEHLMGD
jgi:putative glycosyltransferase (TIGR04372 family)